MLDWVESHFYEGGSYELSVGYQVSAGLKRGLDATVNLQSSVISEGSFSNRTMSGEYNSYDNSKWTHELSLSADVGGGIKYTNDYNAGKELQFSAGALGFLGGSISVDPTSGHVSNWFIGIDIDAHFAAIFGIEGEYKLGLGK